jgi:RimJ/RimL family protein N-acetyltransferase
MLRGAGWWAAELRETGEVVGTVGAFFREASPELEIGWSIYRRFWRRGFATEAAAAALAFAVERHSAEWVIAHISAENLASVRVAEHLGMRYERDVDFFGMTIGRFVIDGHTATARSATGEDGPRVLGKPVPPGE